MTTPTRKTDEEILTRIAHFQAIIADEESNSLGGSHGWMEAVAAEHWLKWVLGE